MTILRNAALAAVALGLGAGAVAIAQNGPVETRPPITPYKPAFPGQTRAPEQKLGVAFNVVPVAQNLANPWAIAFLPDGRMLMTEKGSAGRGAPAPIPAQLRIVGKDGAVSAPVTGLPPITSAGQGGLLDVALAPDYARSNQIYFCFSNPDENNTNHTALARAKLVDGPQPRLEGLQVIFKQSPSLASNFHFGCRIVFSRDGKVFLTMGERSVLPGRVQAQDLKSLIGKIVRLNLDGAVPADNPFVGRADARPEIWSYGNRNVQAAALHPQTGELWEVEYGPQAGDELNVIKKGRDYGWPTITYGVEYGPQKKTIGEGITQKAGMEQPVYYWDPVIAPSGMVFYTGNLFPRWRGSLFVSGLQPQGLPGGYVARLTVEGEKVVGEERLDLPPGRFRDIRQGPDGAIYLLQSGPAGSITKLVPKP